MMKRMSRYSRTSRLLVLLLCALLLASMLPSYGASKKNPKKTNNNGKGVLEVTLANRDKLPEGVDVEYTLYRIGVPAPDTAAGWKFDDAIATYGDKIIGFDENRPKTELQEIVDELAETIVNGNFKFDYAKAEKLTTPKGSAKYTGLADGIYLGVLTKAPEGLSANASLFTIPHRNNGQTGLEYTQSVTIKDTYNTGDLTISKAVVSPYDADKTATYVFTVTLTRDGKVLDIDGPFKTAKGDSITFKDGVAKVSVKGGESVTIVGLPYGVGYTVTEVDAKGLTPTSTGATGTIEAGSTAAFTNKREVGVRYVPDAVTVYKVDEAMQPLEGATFVLYADEKLTEVIDEYNGGSFQISTDDEALEGRLPTEGKSATFYLVETIAPIGYKLDSTPRKVVIETSVSKVLEEGKYVTVTTYTIKIEDEETAYVVNPPFTDVDRVDDKVTVRKTDGKKQLSGATFTLYDGNNAVTTFTGRQFEISTADEALKDVLPAAGETKELILKETGAPTGYTGSDAEYRIEIKASETKAWDDKHTKLITTTTYTITIDGEKSVDVVNTPNTDEDRKDDSVKVTKTDGSKLISGATFTLYDGNRVVTTFTGGQFEISTANKALKGVLPAVGKTRTLTLKETKAPTGYTGSDAMYTVVIKAEKETAWNKQHTKLVATTVYTITIDGEEALSVPNKPETGSDVAYRNVTVHKVDGEGQSLKGAEFTLYSDKTPIATYGGRTVDSFSISTDDKKLAKYLPKPGETVTLTLKETKAPSGYSLTPREYEVVLSASVVTDWNEDHTKLITVTVYDISIDDKVSVTVVNEPVVTPPPGGGGGGGVPEPPAPTPTPTPVTEISGTKIWDDEGNIHKVRPGSIEVTLYANGSPVGATPSWSKSGNQWTYTFSNLPELDDSGNKITYTVKESPVNYYESTVSGLVITNKLIPREPERYTDLSGEKTWNDRNNAQGKRPTSITVRLLRDGVEIESRKVTAGTNWSYTFQHLPVDDGYGNIYTYEVHEDGVSGYYSRSDGRNFTNSLIDGSVPPPPTSDGETPPPDGGVPTVPRKPEDVPERKTGTPVPPFEEKGDEELEELFDMFGYGTPLYGMFGTGDQIPAWVWICGAVGILALVMAIVMGRKKRRSR